MGRSEAASKRLDGRTVVVTRGVSGSDALGDRLAELGARVRVLPSIACAPPADQGPLEAALRGLRAFDWVVFASATAVERVVEQLARLGIDRAELAARGLAAVGPATAARLERAVRPPDLVPGEATGEAMASALAARVAGRRVLLPRAADGRQELLDGLSAAGAEVTVVEAYRTVPSPPELLRPLAAWIAAGEVDAVAFASPSAVRAVTAALGAEAVSLARVLLGAIGPTTAEALRDAGLPVGALPADHTGRGLAEAIASRLAPG
jgi:uroporphyrinogen-III synthase/uroporphyrinogen III methyltransferase/synthase